MLATSSTTELVTSDGTPAIDPITQKWIRNKSDEHAAAAGCRFDQERGQSVVDWIESYCCLWEGARGPMRLKDWQYEATMRIFGWVKWSGELGRWIRRFTKACVWVPKKNAKCLALDTPIPTPSGWKSMGEIEAGDIVFSADGTQCRVVAAYAPKLDPDCYEVSFSNGEKIKCNGEHLWLTTALQRQIGENGKGKPATGNQWTGPLGLRWSRTAVRSTVEIAKTLRRGDGACNHSIQMPNSISMDGVDLPMHPYVFGCWLGDGDSDCARITCSADDLPEYRREFAACGYAVEHCAEDKRTNGKTWRFRFQAIDSHPERTTLKSMGVFKDKKIPSIYLRAAAEQRIALLQGLMDTDGTVDKSGKCITYSTKLDSLRNGVCELLSSLGIKHKTREYCPVISGLQRRYFSIQFHSFTDQATVFRLPRKIKRLRKTSDLQIRPRSRTVQITNIERIAPVPVRCIKVDHPSSLYLCGKTMIPTHNTPTAAAWALYLLAGDGEQGNHVFFAAADGQQARLAAKHAVEMVKASPELNEDDGGEIGINLSEMKLIHRPTLSDAKPISSGDNRAARAKQGLNGSVIIDEIHVVDDQFISNSSLDMAGISREEPLHIEVSTAGKDPDGYGRKRYEYGKSIEAGQVIDERFFFLCYEAPQELTDEDLDADPVKWGRMANPSWGRIVKEAEFLATYEEKKRSVADLADFKTFRLNIWQHAASPWLNVSDWRACRAEFTEADLLGKVCFGGLDLSKTRDMTALALAFPIDAVIRVLVYFFMPEAGLKALAVKVPRALDWAKRGLIRVTPGATTDYREIKRLFKEKEKKFQIDQLLYDDWNAEQVTQELAEETGVERVAFGQNMKTYNEPMKDLEARILERTIQHDGNEVLDWQIGHTEVAERNANIMPAKPERAEHKKIDGVVAAIMASAPAMRYGGETWIG
jgi:phage terminase large subunit-like protein